MDTQLWATCPHRPQLFYVKILGKSSSTTCCEKKSHQFRLAYCSATPWEKLNITSWEIMHEGGRYFAKFRELFFQKKIFFLRKKFKFIFWSKIILKYIKHDGNALFSQNRPFDTLSRPKSSHWCQILISHLSSYCPWQVQFSNPYSAKILGSILKK